MDYQAAPISIIHAQAQQTLQQAGSNPRQWTEEEIFRLSTGLAVAMVLTLATIAMPVSARILFDDVTAESGITDTGETYGNAIGDLNGDGCPDIWLDKHQYTPTVILRNRCDGSLTFDQFREEPDNSNGGLLGVYSGTMDTHGVGFSDFDNDGDQDMLEVVGGGARNLFWVNDGLGNFRNRDVNYGFVWPLGIGICNTLAQCRPIGRRSPLWFDYDYDGRLDLIITARGNINAYRAPTAVFKQTVQSNGSWLFVYDGLTGVDYQSLDYCAYASMADLSGDGILDIICADSNKILKIWDISQGVPFRTIESDRLGTALFTTWPYDLAIGDFNGDLRNDIFAPLGQTTQVAVDQVDTRTLHSIHQKGSNVTHAGYSFTASGSLTIDFDWWTTTNKIHLGASGKSPAASTDLHVYNGVGHHVRLTLSPTSAVNTGQPVYTAGVTPGIFIWFDGNQWQVRISNANSLGNDYVGMVVQATQSISNLTGVGQIGINRPATKKPYLFIQNAAGVFQNVSSRVSSTGSSCMSAAAGDFDNDMDLDLIEVCSDLLKNRPNRIYENKGIDITGNVSFTPVVNAGADAGLGLTGAQGQMPFGKSETVLTADFDGDGRLDVFFANGQPFRPFSEAGQQQVMRNLSDNGTPSDLNHWIQVDLEGAVSNRDGIGAWLIFTTPDGTSQLREQANGMHIYAQNFKRIHAGLGRNPTVDLTIHWPNGTLDTHTGLPADRIYRCQERGRCASE